MSEDNPLVQSAGYSCLLPIAIIIIVVVVLLMLFHADGSYTGALVALIRHKVSYERRDDGHKLWRITSWTLIGLPIYVREEHCR